MAPKMKPFIRAEKHLILTAPDTEFENFLSELDQLSEREELLSKVVFELKIKRQSGFQESPRFHQRIVHLQSPLPGNQSHVTFSNSFLHIVPA